MYPGKCVSAPLDIEVYLLNSKQVDFMVKNAVVVGNWKVKLRSKSELAACNKIKILR